MEKEILIRYAEILNRVQQDSNMDLSENDKLTINNIRELVSIDQRVSEIVNNVQRINNPEERIAYINSKYVVDPTIYNNQDKTTEEEIAETFNVNVGDIRTISLQNNKELFQFYDLKNQRMVVLENQQNEISLSNQLEELKKLNNNSAEDSKDILKEQSVRENIELKFIPINEIDKYMYLTNNFSENDLLKLSTLIKNSYNLGIDIINIENIIGMNNAGEIYEASYNNIEQKYVVYKSDEINSNEKNETVENKENKNDVESYNIDEVESLDNKEEIENIDDTLELAEKPKQKVKKRNIPRKEGYIDIMLLSLVTGFLAGITVTILMLVLNK